VHALLALAVDADDALPLLDLKDLALDRMLEELSLVSLAACRHGVRLRGDQRALLHGQPMGAPRPAEMGSRARRCRVHGVGGGAGPYFFGAQVQNDRKGPYSQTKTIKTVYCNLKNHYISITKNIQYIS
jgi:hypothetical protein